MYLVNPFKCFYVHWTWPVEQPSLLKFGIVRVIYSSPLLTCQLIKMPIVFPNLKCVHWGLIINIVLVVVSSELLICSIFITNKNKVLWSYKEVLWLSTFWVCMAKQDQILMWLLRTLPIYPPRLPLFQALEAPLLELPWGLGETTQETVFWQDNLCLGHWGLFCCSHIGMTSLSKNQVHYHSKGLSSALFFVDSIL